MILIVALTDHVSHKYFKAFINNVKIHFKSTASYHFQKNYGKNDFFDDGFYSGSQENSIESPYFYPIPRSSPFSYEVKSSSDESNEIESHGGETIFSYDERDIYGPSNWGKINANCDGVSQSPVNLHTYTALPSFLGQPLIIDRFDDIPMSVTVKNTGHSSSFNLKFKNNKPARLLGGPLKTAYNLDNIHFHWGERDHAGSEHLINSRRYSAEVHLVFYSSKYGEIS